MSDLGGTANKNDGSTNNSSSNRDWATVAASLPHLPPELTTNVRPGFGPNNGTNYPMFDQTQVLSSVMITMAAQAETVNKMTDQHSAYDQRIVHLGSVINEKDNEVKKIKKELDDKKLEFDSEVANHDATKKELENTKTIRDDILKSLNKETEDHKNTKNDLAIATLEIAHLNEMLNALKKRKGLGRRLWDVVKEPA